MWRELFDIALRESLPKEELAEISYRIAGIFTSKDIVLRVIAAGLEPSRCSLVRVMTPHPDVAPPTMTVQDALKKMYSEYQSMILWEGQQI